MAEPGIAQKVAFLRTPGAYSQEPGHVEWKETHMSWLFLTERHVWKLKKPVRYDYLDFSTVEARRRNCEVEVELNRRLAQDVYLGTVPLVAEQDGSLRLGGTGRVIDWLVWMRRLPQERMLDAAIAAHTVSREDVENVGALLARFYKQAARISWTAAEYRTRLEAAATESALELRRSNYELPTELIGSVHARQLGFVAQQASLFDSRVSQGKLVDAHGDLRPEHICLVPEPVIIDCLEFNADFRVLDPASELAFLNLECRRLGATWVGSQILATYSSETKDHPPAPLLAYYERQHALLRAKIAVWHLNDSEIRDAAKWIAKAKDYLFLAASLQ